MNASVSETIVACERLLQHYWGYAYLKEDQKRILTSLLVEKKDVLALLPTGGGKSVCYQIPALYWGGITLVISPLIALMNDQIAQLRERGIAAAAIHSNMSNWERKSVYEQLQTGRLHLLYLAPEKVADVVFIQYLKRLPIRLLAIDEAHCISEWGHAFRPAYLKIKALRAALAEVPCIALSASATELVRKDIFEKLLFKQDRQKTLIGSFERPELCYAVRYASDKNKKVEEILSKVAGNSIIYCQSRKDCERLSAHLQKKGISADFYHAGLNMDARNLRQKKWTIGAIPVIVCTNAFGMGIDKSDVRLVIHYSPPKHLEHYYQEAGRAGRDGKRAYAALLYNDKDLFNPKKYMAYHFPSVAVLSVVYEGLYTFLHIAPYHDAGVSFAFYRVAFLENILLSKELINTSLHLLERHGILHITQEEEAFFFIHCTASRELIQQQIADRAPLLHLLELLFRKYPGIRDRATAVYPASLSAALQQSAEQVAHCIDILDKMGIIKYRREQHSAERIILLHEKTEDLTLLLQMPLLKKQQAEAYKKVEAMLHYIQQNKQCRSAYINAYFVGGRIEERCGHCDVCLGQSGTGRRPFKR